MKRGQCQLHAWELRFIYCLPTWIIVDITLHTCILIWSSVLKMNIKFLASLTRDYLRLHLEENCTISTYSKAGGGLTKEILIAADSAHLIITVMGI